MQAIILAGGEGTRLKSLTSGLPKPLVPLGDVPVLEVVLRQLRAAGFRRVVLAVNYLADVIRAQFGDGSRIGLEIGYSFEDTPLGTAGPLRLVEALDESFLVVNGDILTTLDYAAVLREHRARGDEATIAIRACEVRLEYGVIRTGADGGFLDYLEKPLERVDVSMGVYALRRTALAHVPAGRRFDIPDLVRAIHAAGARVGCFRADGCYWRDIGNVADYESAVRDFAERRSEFLP